MSNVKNLIFSPHVDDELLGCFSFLNKNTHVIETGVDEFHVVDRKERLNELEKLASHCSFTYSVLDNVVNKYNLKDLIDQYEAAVNEYKPELALIPYPSYNQDHRAVYDASLVALRHHDVNHFVKKILVFEQPHSYIWDYNHSISGAFKPNYYSPVDIEDKLYSYGLLESQVRGHRSPEILKSLGKMRGYQAQIDFAEAFQILRWIE
ncbi:hypothetical protein N9437_02955 [Acidimicrobiia bacterium]|nr:hypothetical protein [Acidimicrobiia bacterium]